MNERPRLARAALALASLLFALALSEGAPPPADCPAPRERRAEGGHTVELACSGAAEAAEVRGPARLLVGLPVDPNGADAATLECLPGVGPARARAIVAARAERPFRSLADLDRVPGLGPRTVAGLAGRIAIGAAPGGGLGPPDRDRVGCARACRTMVPQGEP